jgi:RNA polymerase sigma-70 factor, ECF subfamily
MTGTGQQSTPGVFLWQRGWPQTLEEFERLVDAFQDRLVRHAHRRLGSLSDAEDVVQEVFLRAFAERDQRKTVANVGAYLYRMTGNRATDVLRRQRRHGEVSVEEMPALLEIPSHGPHASAIAASAEECERVERLLLQVSPEQAEVIRLRVMDELPPRDIAQVLGCPIATVKSRLRYGMEKLRQIICRDGEVNR